MSINYEWKWGVYQGEQTNDLEECRFCSAIVPLYNFPTHGFGARPDRPERYLCELCAQSPAGNAEEYPDQFNGKDVMRVTNCSANMILLQLGKWGAPGAIPTLNPNYNEVES